MTSETPMFIDISLSLPEDAVEVLKDGQTHAAMSSPKRMSALESEPLTFWINSKAEKPLGDLEYPSSGQCYRLEFVRNEGSWVREEYDLLCKGKAIIGGNELPVTLFTMDGVVFFRHTK